MTKPKIDTHRKAIPSSGPRPTAVLMRLCEVLEDGLWHAQEEVIKVVGKTIPPGVAVRKNEGTRVNNGGPPERKKPLDISRQIDSGRRTIVREMILTKGNFETAEIDGVRKVRMAHLPDRVYYQRSRILAESLRPATLSHSLAGGDPRTMLASLTYDQLLTVAVELAWREKTRNASQVNVWDQPKEDAGQ